MTVALAGRAPATFEIKSANLPLVALLLKSADLGALAAELATRFGDIPDFFDNDPLVLDLTPLHGQGDAQLDFAALLSLLRGYKVMPVAARGGNEEQMKAALAAGRDAQSVLEEGRQALAEVGERFDRGEYFLSELTVAAEAFRRATLLEPKNGMAFNNLAQVLAEQGKRKEALATAQRAVELGGPLLENFKQTLEEIKKKAGSKNGQKRRK